MIFLFKSSYPGENITFDEHLKPNAFGLKIASNPYNYEISLDCKLVGDDGGRNICGGAGYVFGWFPLASAYKGYNIPERDEELFGLNVRRVINL